MRPNMLFAVLFAIISIACAENYVCTSCECTDRDVNIALKRGDLAPICIQFITDGTTYVKAPFAIKVDEYSVLIAGNAFATFVNTPAASTSTSSDTRIIAQTDTDHYTKALPFANVTTGTTIFYANLYNLVIRLTDGIVTELVWDNTCGICSDLSCYTDAMDDGQATNLCEVQSTCKGTTYTASCDPKIYVTWIGTDSAGTALTSAGLRMSQFTKYSITGLYSQAASLVKTTVTNVKSST